MVSKRKIITCLFLVFILAFCGTAFAKTMLYDKTDNVFFECSWGNFWEYQIENHETYFVTNDMSELKDFKQLCKGKNIYYETLNYSIYSSFFKERFGDKVVVISFKKDKNIKAQNVQTEKTSFDKFIAFLDIIQPYLKIIGAITLCLILLCVFVIIKLRS